MATHDSAFRPDIEGLRAIAILLVVAFHVGVAGFHGGFVGVDVFFVLSGYLISGLLVEEIEATGTLDFVRFYGRRARRLLPACALVLVVTVLASAAVFSPTELATLASTALATALYGSNFWFAQQAGDYFAADARHNPLLHTWSLAVEEQFYLVWPVIVLVGLSRRRSRGWLLVTFAALSIISFTGSVWLTHARQPWAFYLTPARAWEFGLGGLVRFVRVPRFVTPRVRYHFGWLGFAAILAAAQLFTPATPFPGVAALLPSVGTAAVLLVGAEAPREGVGQLLAIDPLQGIGRLSYSWYLWHWPVLVLALTLAPELAPSRLVLCALMALALAAAAHRFLENPVRFSPVLARRPRLSLGLAAAMMTIGVGVALSSSWFARWEAALPEQRRFAEASALDGMERVGCLEPDLESAVRECVFGDSTSPKMVVLFGDSHASQWFPAIAPIARSQHWRLVTIGKGSCPVARVAVYNRPLKRDYRECGIWREAALRRIVALRPAGVIIAQYSRGEFKSVNAYGVGERLSYDEWRTGMHSVLQTLDSAGIRTIVLRDSPTAPFHVPSCLSHAALRRWYANERCDFPRERALDTLTTMAERKAMEGLAHVAMLDLNDQICGSAICPAVLDGMVVYRDYSHLTVTFARRLMSVMAARLVPALSGENRQPASQHASSGAR